MDKFQENHTKFHKQNVKEGPAFFLDSIKQFFENFKQPTQQKVKEALIWAQTDPNCDTEYIIKAGGGSKADHRYESIVKVDGLAVYKKYSTDFNTVLITEQELEDLIKPLIPKEEIIEDHIFSLVLFTKKYVAGQIKEEVNWADSFKSSYISQSELIKRYQEKIKEAYNRKIEDNPTTEEEYRKRFIIFENETKEDIEAKVEFNQRSVQMWEKILDFANNIENLVVQ